MCNTFNLLSFSQQPHLYIDIEIRKFTENHMHVDSKGKVSSQVRSTHIFFLQALKIFFGINVDYNFISNVL